MRATHPVAAAFAASLLLVASGCADDATTPIPPAASAPSTRTGPAEVPTTSPTTTATETTIAVTPTVTPTPATTVPGTSVAPATTAPAVSAPVEVSAPFGNDPDSADFVVVRWLLPWDDGFLAIGQALDQPTLPEALPPDIVELFPEALIDLFPDGLPELRQDAYDDVVAAGLEDELMAVLDEHPEVRDLLTQQPIGVTLVAATTSDGTSWRRTDLDMPGGLAEPTALSTIDGRITIVAVRQGDDERPALVQVVTTRDLARWAVDDFEVGELDPEAGSAQPVYPVAVAANDSGWVVDVMVESEIGASSTDDQRWTAAWGEPATRVDTGIRPRLLATSAGFVDLDDDLEFSNDGVTWTQVSLPEPETEVVAAAPFEGGVIVVADTPSHGVGTYRLDPSATIWEQSGSDLDLGTPFFSVVEPTSPAFVFERSQGGLWLLASGDGTTWLCEPYPLHDDGYPPFFAAVDDTALLVGEADWGWAPEGLARWLRFELPN